ncbi:MAG: hypothetical protein KGJ43_03960, partial [Acidobacteriota bacterium]|nr:hypothetical protein [Acidobacteriota bacterium]
TIAAGAAADPASADAGDARHHCGNCKAPMADEQDWCVQCGTADKRSMRTRAGLASAGGLMAASALLATGAAAAGVAALTQSPAHEPAHRLLSMPPVTQPPASATTTPVNPGTPETLKTPRTAPAPAPASSSSTSPASTPASSSGSSATTQTTTTTTTTTTGPPPAIELQAQDLSVYNPHHAYPAADAGDPRKSFEEGALSLWDVQVQPAGASKLDVGLLVHLRSPRRTASMEVITSTPGYTVEVFGAKGEKAPKSISDPAWTRLALQSDVRRKSTIALSHSNERFPYIVVWITAIPSSLAGSAGSPGRVSLDELALLPVSG